MRRLFVLLLVMMVSAAKLPNTILANGIPFVRNFTADEYDGHNRNFDVVTDSIGNVFVANFEGLLYYDNANWRMLHTPGVTRVTSVFRDSKGIIWTGGYNYFGRVEQSSNGAIRLRECMIGGNSKIDISEIWENDGILYAQTSNEHVFKLVGDSLLPAPGIAIDNNSLQMAGGRQVVAMSSQIRVMAVSGSGLTVMDSNGNRLFDITEADGLCSNSITHIHYDGRGTLWGTTDHGIFAVDILSRYTRMDAGQGLRGDVLTMEILDGRLFVGTIDGLFVKDGMTMRAISAIRHACWQLTKDGNRLLAATADGVYSVTAGGDTHKLSNANTTAVMAYGNGFLSGEIGGVTYYGKDGGRSGVSDLEKVTLMETDSEGTVWLTNLYGEVWCKKKDDTSFAPFDKTIDNNEPAIAICHNGKVIVAKAGETEPYPFPYTYYSEDTGALWLTNQEGKNLAIYNKGGRDNEADTLFHPMADYGVRAMKADGERMWVGGDFGIICIYRGADFMSANDKPHLRLRSVVNIVSDSLLWGGYGDMPEKLSFDSDERYIRITYSVDRPVVMGKVLYHFRVNGGRWSQWSEDTQMSFSNLSYGDYLFEVEAMDVYGRLTDVAGLSFTIATPFYLRWYMNLLWLAVLVLLVYVIVKWRMRRLEKEKQELENIVTERTKEVVRQKDEIEEKSNRLETALTELHDAQNELIRQEKMATAGKLTQGLIDRILNPLNYINNFSKMSQGLLKDLKANIEDEKENMNEDNYEDTIDVLGMLDGNLEKVSEHGANTTRTLKAMEEMLKDHTGGKYPMNLVALLRQNEEMTAKFYADDIKEYGIKVTFDVKAESIDIDANGEQLSKAFMSIIGNSVYAVKKKAMRKAYDAAISVTAEVADGKTTIVFADNGIGIEDTIINKIFDPFFTTKPTGEASGVGLYLTKEIVLNHGGTITAESQKDQFTRIIITL